MKKKQLHFLLWITLTYTLIACSPKEPQFVNTLEQENLKGDIESIIVEKYFDWGMPTFGKEEYKYSENKFIKERITNRYRCEYDEFGRILAKYYNNEKEVNENYKIVKNRSEAISNSYYYNDKGLVETYIEDGDTTKYIYNNENKLIESRYNRANVKTIRIKTYEYDENGDLYIVKERVSDLEGNIKTYLQIESYDYLEYDGYGNWIERRYNVKADFGDGTNNSASHYESRDIKYREEHVDNNVDGEDNIPNAQLQNTTSIKNIHTEAQSVFVVNQNNVRFQEVQNVKGDVGIGKNYNYWLTDKIRVPQGERWTVKKALCVRNQNGSKFSTNISLVHLIDGTSGGYRKEYDLTNERHNITLVGGDIFILKAFNAHAEYTISMDVEFEETNEY